MPLETPFYVLLKAAAPIHRRGLAWIAGTVRRWARSRAFRHRLLNPSAVGDVGGGLGPTDGLDLSPEIHPSEPFPEPLHALSNERAIARAAAARPRRSPAVRLLTIDRAHVLGQAAVVSGDGRLLRQLSREIGRRAEEHPVFLRPYWRRRAILLERAAAVLGPGADNYFHWTLELLPRLMLAARTDSPVILMPRPTAAFQRDALGALNLTSERIAATDPDTAYEVGTLTAPIFPTNEAAYLHFAPTWVVAGLRQLFGVADAPAHGLTRRLYVTRRDSAYRSVLNDEELTSALTGLGFEPVTLSGRSVAEQAELFAQAEAVVAPHGAALANIVFCRPGAAVVELFPPTYLNMCFWVLAVSAGLRHEAVIGRLANPLLEAMPLRLQRVNFSVDIAAVRGALGRLGIG